MLLGNPDFQSEARCKEVLWLPEAVAWSCPVPSRYIFSGAPSGWLWYIDFSDRWSRTRLYLESWPLFMLLLPKPKYLQLTVWSSSSDVSFFITVSWTLSSSVSHMAFLSMDPAFICECVYYHHGSLLSAKVQTGAIGELDCASYFSSRTGCST